MQFAESTSLRLVSLQTELDSRGITNSLGGFMAWHSLHLKQVLGVAT